MRHLRTGLILCLVLAAAASAGLGSSAVRAQARPRLAPADVDAIAALLKLEDTRRLDAAVLTPLLTATHPEVRRRAVQTIGRINDPAGKALLVSARGETDPEVLATVAFSTGQLRDAEAIGWLDSLLSAGEKSPVVAREAARSLGKIRTIDASAALVRYLNGATATRATTPVVAEALLSLGRFVNPTQADAPPVRARGDVAAAARWITSANVEIRWRTAWALTRLRDPEAVPSLMQLVDDRSPDVRHWAARGLSAAVVARSTVDRARVSAKLRAAVKDSDRRVRTEALRALSQYEDDESFAVVLAELESKDSWMFVSAAEAMGRFDMRREAETPKVIAAVGEQRPTALRMTALAPLAILAPDAAREAANALSKSESVAARGVATQTLQRLDAAAAAQAGARGGAGRAGGGGAGGGGRGGGGRGAPPARPERPDADYRRLVEQWIVPAYNGAPAPRVIWQTPRGEVEIELYPGDAPFGVEYLMKVMQSGAIVGTEFGRVVPNFVAQQRAIAGADLPLRDEVSRRGLAHGNLSWASAGLDTGRPGYTLATAPHPHIEGDFTALGRIVRGMAAVDRIELSDRIIAARIR